MATSVIEQARKRGSTVLSEVEAKQLLAEAGVPVVEAKLATSSDAAVSAADALGYPVAHGERYLLRSVARVGDLSNMEIDLDPKTWETRRRLLGQYCDEEGRDPNALGFTHNATVITGETDIEVRAGVERYIDAHGLSRGDARRRLAHAVVGKPEECTERLRGYRAQGTSWLFLLFPDLPDLRSLRLFGERVLPAFQ